MCLSGSVILFAGTFVAVWNYLITLTPQNVAWLQALIDCVCKSNRESVWPFLPSFHVSFQQTAGRFDTLQPIGN